MDDVRTDLKAYFEAAVTPMDLADIVGDASYVVGASGRSDLRRGTWGKSLWLAAGVVIVILVWGLIALTSGTGNQETAGPGGVTVTTVASTVPEPSSGTLDLLDFTYTTTGFGWESFDGFRLQKSATGPQGAEGIVYWVTYPHSDSATNCALEPEHLATNPLDNLALGVAHAPGLNLVAGPDDVFVGGLTARYVQAEIAADDGCDPGFFYQWQAENMGALWTKYSTGMAVDVWVVDVGARHLLIVGLTDPEFPALRDEIREFVDSIEFRTG